MKCLYVGDPHVKVSNLDESRKLMEFVLVSAVTNSVDRIVLLGDLFHTHAALRLEVVEFWHHWLDRLSAKIEVIAMVGNHDQSGDYNAKYHSLSLFKEIGRNNLRIIDEPTQIGCFGYMPYIHSQEQFVREANLLSAKVLVCHQTFDGSKFDNGMYAPEGFDPGLLNATLVISGHIHSRQRFGKLIYPGTATWQTTSDANQAKGLWLVNHSDDGSIITEEFLDTSTVVEPILEVTWAEGSEMPELPSGRMTVELIGSSTWVAQQKAALKGKVQFKTKITDKAQARTRKTGSSLEDFTRNVFSTSTDRDELISVMKELALV